MTSYWCEYAFVDGSTRRGVRIGCGEDGRITEVTVGVDQGDAPVIAGVTLPGLANGHSHAFHRALRGRTNTRGSFWTWREEMYRIANLLDPDTYLDLATATYAEMVMAGYTAVGEFHYLHHQPDGRPYDNPNQMGEVLCEAARRAGIRLTLLDTCYLRGGIGQPLRPEQIRFGDTDAEAWATRVSSLSDDENTRIGAAIHSVRAVPEEATAIVAAAAANKPLHLHLSEQIQENGECLAIYGLTPTQFLANRGVLGPTTTAVHATHVEPEDIALLASSATSVCLCPTTERDLGDGIDPGFALDQAGVRLALGTDQHVTIDAFEEMRGLEMNQRLKEKARGLFPPEKLLGLAAANGHEVLGWPGGGRIEVGAHCDLVGVDPCSVRTAGSEPDQIVMAATTADVKTVIVGGRRIVDDGKHQVSNVPQILAAAINPLWE
ncbi:MAG: formimidoylglutamate deiminase [Acidimicrobiia bacterium]